MILIQGAGISGLTLAALLEQRNMAYTVVEKRTHLDAIGAGIVLQKNALDVLSGLSATPIENSSAPIKKMRITTPEDIDLQSLTLDEHTQAQGIHRRDLQEFLLQHVNHTQLKTGTWIENWHLRDGIFEVELNNQERCRATTIIGADGIGSQIRAKLGASPTIRNSNHWCTRTIIEGQPCAGEGIELWAGRHRLGIVPLANNQSYVYWVRARHEGHIAEQHIHTTIRGFGRLGKTVASYLTRDQKWLQHSLADVPVYWGQGRVVLIGDASHAVTPNMGQGAALGIEDAYILTHLLQANHPTPAELLRQRRHKRIRNVRELSYLTGKIAHLENTLLRKFYASLIRLTPERLVRQRLRGWLNAFINKA